MSQAGVNLTHHFTQMIPMLNVIPLTYHNCTEQHNMKNPEKILHILFIASFKIGGEIN